MTSGPMRAGALPPDRQPDPQVVAWMRDYLRGNPDVTRQELGTVRMSTCRAYREAHATSSGFTGVRVLVDSFAEAARKPLTVADIPAGQGAASLFLTKDADGDLAAWFKDADGSVYLAVRMEPSPWKQAIMEHLAATLPVTTEEGA